MVLMLMLIVLISVTFSRPGLLATCGGILVSLICGPSFT